MVDAVAVMKQRKARVIYQYSPQNQDELALTVNDVIEVLEEVEEGWWRGKLKGTVGVFPSNFVSELDDNVSFQQELNSALLSKSGSSSDLDRSDSSEALDSPHRNSQQEIKPKKVLGTSVLPANLGNQLKSVLRANADKKANVTNAIAKRPPVALPPHATDNGNTVVGNNMSDPAPKLPPKPVREQAKVLFAYEAQNEDELSIKEGDVINIISKEIEDQGWWRGELNGKLSID